MRRRVHNVEQFAANCWHRPTSLGRFIDPKRARKLAAFDMDLFEFDYATNKCLLLHEFKILNQNSSGKFVPTQHNTDVTVALAKQMDCTAWLTLYKLADYANPENHAYPDIEWFWNKRIWPLPEPDYISMSPQQYAVHLNNTVEYLRSK